MKQSVYVILFLAIVLSLMGMNQDAKKKKKQQASPGPISGNVTVCPTISSENDNNTAAKLKNSNSTETDTTSSSMLTSLKKTYKTYEQQVTAGLLAHTYLLAAVGGSTGYLYVCYWCVQANRYLESPLRWSLFKAECSLQSLRSIPYDQFISDLLFEIHTRYICTDDPLNDTEPIATFLTSIDTEHHLLSSYYTRYSLLKPLFLHKLVPIKTVLFEAIPARIDRLTFIRHSFITWASHMKVKRQHAGEANL